VHHIGLGDLEEKEEEPQEEEEYKENVEGCRSFNLCP
jgi:hypothetical protein